MQPDWKKIQLPTQRLETQMKLPKSPRPGSALLAMVVIMQLSSRLKVPDSKQLSQKRCLRQRAPSVCPGPWQKPDQAVHSPDFLPKFQLKPVEQMSLSA